MYATTRTITADEVQYEDAIERLREALDRLVDGRVTFADAEKVLADFQAQT